MRHSQPDVAERALKKEVPMGKGEHEDEPEPSSKKPKLVDVKELRPEGYDGSCLRPLGMCDLGSCDVCWHNPGHPRFKKKEGE